MKEPEFQKCLQVQAVKTLRETIYFCLESREKGFCETTSVGQGRIPCFPQISLPALPRNPQCQNLTATVSGMLSMQPCWHLNSIWQKKLGKRGSCGLKNMGGFVFAYYFFSYFSLPADPLRGKSVMWISTFAQGGKTLRSINFSVQRYWRGQGGRIKTIC